MHIIFSTIKENISIIIMNIKLSIQTATSIKKFVKDNIQIIRYEIQNFIRMIRMMKTLNILKIMAQMNMML